MKKKTYKELEKEVIDLKIKKHTKRYIHIPVINLIPLLGVFIFSILTYLNLKLIDWNLIKIVFSSEEIIKEYVFNYSQLINIYPIIAEYILIVCAIVSLVALFKGGYKYLNKYNKEGIIKGLIFGLIFGLIGGLVIGLIGGLIFGLIFGLIGGLVIGLIGGLVIGLIGGLMGGLTEEFEK